MKTKLSVVLSTIFVAVTVADELSLFKPRSSGLAVRNFIILLPFAHVIFIEINVDKIINAFTKNFL